ncbi:MAG: hypothetical protein CFH01_01105 [Alphaproteobacteria bacterium MarineAlpha2_Bin1]|nr:MAG: hypothetical protein CFH01_01105 [Alphaproteobacteria bacterium MarineAlpha2_Bin1]
MKKILFIILFWSWSIVINILFIPSLVLPRKVVVFGQKTWAVGIMYLLRKILNLTYAIEGKELLPVKPYIIAIKHQSMWDTIILHLIDKDPAIVMKKELLKIPIYGWYCKKSKMIPIDRSAGLKSLKFMLKESKKALKENRNIIIFPQGTRVPPREKSAYLPGTYLLYNKLNITVIPCALNSGLFWPSNNWPATGGNIKIRFLNPIHPGLDKDHFGKELKESIERESDLLID